MLFDPTLDDHVDEQVQKAFDVGSCKLPAAHALLDQQNELFKRQLGAGSVNTGYRTGMAGVDVSQVVERFLRSQLGKENSIGLHPQTSLEQLLGRDTRQTLVVLAIEQAHVIGMPVEHEFLGVFDRHETLFRGNLADQRLSPGCLSRPCRP